MTDLQIVYEALSNDGFTQDDVFARVEVLSARLTEEAKKVTSNGTKFFELLPGVRETLQALHDHPRYQSALVTGNIESMAKLKMQLVGLDKYFTLPGAFGDESHNRRDLPARAAERIRKHLGAELAPEQFIVIGDTPNDIDCARYFGARAVAVGTGRTYLREDIISCEPDALLEDLSDIRLVLETLDDL
jgi:phosphoglycolate phosphatase-like HAD superfamily hydrolase